MLPFESIFVNAKKRRPLEPARHSANHGTVERSFVPRTAEGWDGVEREGYVPGAESNVVRHTLVGKRKQSPDEPGPQFEVRYFEVPPGAVTRLEKHEHEHYVIVGAGVGHAVVGETVREVRQHDVVYVSPLQPHQFVNRGTETFGFFCIVNTVRDFTQPPSAEELARIMASPAGAYAEPNGAPPPRILAQK
jgi:mannose-6-phosphate isomerase-like protein (cupin superfamily)